MGAPRVVIPARAQPVSRDPGLGTLLGPGYALALRTIPRAGAHSGMTGVATYFTATTAISTSMLGLASLASMQARPGRFSPPVQAFQASFMASR